MALGRDALDRFDAQDADGAVRAAVDGCAELTVTLDAFARDAACAGRASVTFHAGPMLRSQFSASVRWMVAGYHAGSPPGQPRER